MGGLSFWHILLLAVVVLVLFGGRGRFSDLMGDFAKGIKNFKKGMADEETPPPAPKSLPREETQTLHDNDKVAH